MIPKIIHYCWFGGKPLPKLAKKCIKSWEKYCPDYEIKRWDESNFDIESCDYTKEAYDAKKWAFVSDYARFWILYHYGGLYFDTDVEMLKPIDNIVAYGAFMGCETQGNTTYKIAPGLGLAANPGLGLAANPGLGLYKEVIDDYLVSHFSVQTMGDNTVVIRVTNILKKHGFDSSSERIQHICGINIYPPEYFSPMKACTGEIHLTNNTYTIHHFAGSWGTPKDRLKAKIRAAIGPKATKAVFAAKAWLRKRNIIK